MSGRSRSSARSGIHRLRGTGRPAVVSALLLILTGAALAEAGVDRPVASVGWLAIGPLTASLLLRWTWTALVGGYAVLLGSLVVLTRPGDLRTGVVQMLVLVMLAVFAVANSVLRERRESQLRAVLHVARVAQDAIARPVPERTGRFRFGAQYRSADPRARIGGDVLDVLVTDRGARVLVADVRGHGLPAVRLAAVVAASFRQAGARPGLSLVEVARCVEHTVCVLGENQECATAVFMDLDERGWAEVVNCGHPPPMRRGPDGHVSALSPSRATTALGMSPQLRSDTYSIAPRDRLVLYTDGLLETQAPTGKSLPLHARVQALDTPRSADAAATLLADALDHSAGALTDDAAVLVVDVDEPPTSSYSDRVALPPPARQL